jgi:undecaprenyl pyrophosphate phosphatase UppP
MQISWRSNPRTPDGWFKRIAISLLAALASFLLSLPVSFMAFLNHLESTDPNDTQIFLAALTSAVLVGLVLAALFFFIVLSILTLLSLRGKSGART